jgi:hypothetical protein
MAEKDLLDEMLYTKKDMIEFGINVADQGTSEDEVEFLFEALYEFEEGKETADGN